MKIDRIGGVLLGIWLILTGLPHFINFQLDSTIRAGIALAAGVLILIRK